MWKWWCCVQEVSRFLRGPLFGTAPAVEQAGYFYGVNSALVGDATTGEIYYQYQSDAAYPIASNIEADDMPFDDGGYRGRTDF